MKMRLSIIPYSEYESLLAANKSGRGYSKTITRNISPRDFGGGKTMMIGDVKFYVYDMWPAHTSGGVK